MKIPYYVTHQHPGRPVWGYWSPCLRRGGQPTLMAKLGFEVVACGEDGPDAWAVAEAWNRRWKAARAAHRAGESVPLGGVEPDVPERERRVWPQNSLGEAFAKFRATYSWRESKKPRTREDWWRGWAMIEGVFGDVEPTTVAFEDLDGWYAALLKSVGVREAHRAMKIWRAMWVSVSKLKRAGGTFYCAADQDPSLGIRRVTPEARTAIWREGEAVRLVKRAIREQMLGLAAMCAVAWDTMLSPVDVRTLTKAQLRGDVEGSLFDLARAKTGRPAIGTLSKRTQRLLEAYMATLPPNLLPTSRIFMTRGGQAGPKGGRPRPPVPYTSNKLGQDFRKVRKLAFPGDLRQLMDFRRSGSVEALAGQVDPGALAGKMANTIDQSRELQRTYLPHQTAVVRLADAARVTGRARLRGSKGPKES